MLLDNTLVFADNKSLTKAAGSVTKSDAIQVSHFERDLGVGASIPLLVKVADAIAMAEAGTVTVSVTISDTAAMGSPVTIATAPVALTAGQGLPAGYTFAITNIPRHADKKFMQITITNEKAVTAGSFTAAIVESIS